MISHIEEQEQSQSSSIAFNASEPLKALGICWDTLNDCFVFCVPPNVLTVSDPETKRSLLSIASTIFDPMGLITPFTIRAKMLFQKLWQRGLQWEDHLDEDIAVQWRSWRSELSQLNCINVPRYFMANIGSSSSIELHGFGDASTKAYGAAVYIRSVDETGCVSTHLVMSKSRVGPTKTVSLGSRDGAVVRALASHQYGPGSIPGPGVICGLSLCWFSTLLRGFFSGVFGFPLSAKTDTQLIRAGCWLCSKVMHGPYSGCQRRLHMLSVRYLVLAKPTHVSFAGASCSLQYRSAYVYSHPQTAKLVQALQ